MIRLLFAALIGAGLMYFFDPRQGNERRQILAERAGKGKEIKGEFGDRMNRAVQAGRETVTDAKSRLQETARVAGDNARDTVDETQRQGRQFAEGMQERAHSVVGDENA